MQIQSYFCFIFVSAMVPWLEIEPPRTEQRGKPEVVGEELGSAAQTG